MAINRDFADIFGEFNAVGARYLLVGGYAVGIHGVPRFTKDLDLWVEPTLTNAARVYSALAAFGAPLDDVTVEDFASEGIFFQIGQPPNRIDIITAIDGVTFKAAWTGRVVAEYGGERIYVIGRRHLIQNKEASGRHRTWRTSECFASSNDLFPLQNRANVWRHVIARSINC